MGDHNFCGKTLFMTLVNICENICGSMTHDKKVKIFKNFLSTYREQSKNYKEDTFYPILRLFLPQLDRKRGPYGIKEHMLAKIYIRILCLSKQSTDSQKLLNYRVPRSCSDVVGDFADVAYFILKPRCSQSGGSLTVNDINDALDNIAASHASNKSGAIDDQLQTMFLKMSALEQKWLIRILLKDMRFGLSENKVLNLFHEDAKDLYDVSNDLQKVCTQLKNSSVRLHEIEINLFEPFRPMLSQRCDVQDVEKDLPKLEYYFVEIKYDGERFQLHYNDGEYKYFSRNGFDYTKTYGCNASDGILTPYLSKQFSSDVTNCILDGEMMCWNTQLNSFTTKGKNVDVKSLRVGNVHQPCFCVFDILYYNGKVLTNKPLTDRLQILDKILQSQEGIIVKGHRETVTSGTEIMKLLNKAIDDCEEGIIVKEPHSVYKPNGRRAGWYKIKPEYTAGIMVELDLLIIGGYHGERRGSRYIRQFLVALAEKSDEKLADQSSSSLVFKSFARVGSGYTKEKIWELNKKLRPFWKQTKNEQIPKSIQWSKEKPDVWIEPQNSFILEIIATETTASRTFAVGHTLRFPRVKCVRYDKPWRDCMTLAEFHKIRLASQGKLCAAHVSTLNTVSVNKRTVRTRKPTVNDESFRPTINTGDVNVISDLLAGLEICVLTGYRDLSKNDIETRVAENGGLVTQNPGKRTFCVLASDEKSTRVRNIVQLNSHDVVNPSWMMDCLTRGLLLDKQPDDFISMSLTTKEKLSSRHDLDSNGLEPPLNGAEKSNAKTDITDEEITKNKQNLLYVGPDLYVMFKDCFAYFDNSTENLEFDYRGKVMSHKKLFEKYGGRLDECINEFTTHVIVHSRIAGLKNDLSKIYSEISGRCVVVTEKWIETSLVLKKRLNEITFNPPKDKYDDFPTSSKDDRLRMEAIASTSGNDRSKNADDDIWSMDTQVDNFDKDLSDDDDYVSAFYGNECIAIETDKGGAITGSNNKSTNVDQSLNVSNDGDIWSANTQIESTSSSQIIIEQRSEENRFEPTRLESKKFNQNSEDIANNRSNNKEYNDRIKLNPRFDAQSDYYYWYYDVRIDDEIDEEQFDSQQSSNQLQQGEFDNNNNNNDDGVPIEINSQRDTRDVKKHLSNTAVDDRPPPPIFNSQTDTEVVQRTPEDGHDDDELIRNPVATTESFFKHNPTIVGNDKFEECYNDSGTLSDDKNSDIFEDLVKFTRLKCKNDQNNVNDDKRRMVFGSTSGANEKHAVDNNSVESKADELREFLFAPFLKENDVSPSKKRKCLVDEFPAANSDVKIIIEQSSSAAAIKSSPSTTLLSSTNCDDNNNNDNNQLSGLQNPTMSTIATATENIPAKINGANNLSESVADRKDRLMNEAFAWLID